MKRMKERLIRKLKIVNSVIDEESWWRIEEERGEVMIVDRKVGFDEEDIEWKSKEKDLGKEGKEGMWLKECIGWEIGENGKVVERRNEKEKDLKDVVIGMGKNEDKVKEEREDMVVMLRVDLKKKGLGLMKD